MVISLTNQANAASSVATIDSIWARVQLLGVLESSSGTLTADGTEQVVWQQDTPTAVFEPRSLLINVDAMQAGDTIEVQVYYRLLAAGVYGRLDYQTYTGADGGLTNGRVLVEVALMPNRYGARVTLTQTAGANRDFPWAAFEEQPA